jgi:hypothetical protein
VLITKEEGRQGFFITDDDLRTIHATEVALFYIFYQLAGVNKQESLDELTAFYQK